MSNSFVSTKARAFKQSQCRARVTKQPGFFDFQILNSTLKGFDDNFAPVGWPIGIYSGGLGPFVPYVDFDYADPRGATFLNPTATQLKNDGWIHETWLSSYVLAAPPTHYFQRIGTTDHARLQRSSLPVGIFNTETIASGFKVRKGVMVVKQGAYYDGIDDPTGVTSPFGVFFPKGKGSDQVQRLKLYDKVPGTITKHTITNTFLALQLANFTGILNDPTHIEEYTPAIGDPPVTFEPSECTFSTTHIRPLGGSSNPYTSGTIEILIFWFYLLADDLPSFPLPFNTATDFFFVG